MSSMFSIISFNVLISPDFGGPTYPSDGGESTAVQSLAFGYGIDVGAHGEIFPAQVFFQIIF